MKKFHGIIVPIITPLATPEELDEAAAVRMINRVIDGGVHGIFAVGSTGEGPALPPQIQKEMISTAVKAAAGRVPVLAGISAASGAEALEMAYFAHEAGADAVVAALPCYLPVETVDAICNFFEKLADASPLPVFVYDMPSMVKTKIPKAAVKRLVKHPNIIGYKDSSGQMDSFRNALDAAKEAGRDDFSVLIGPEHLTLSALQMGGDGGVNGGANLTPEIFSGLYNSFVAGDMVKTMEYQKKILDFQRVYGSPVTTNSVICGLKRELAGEGVIQNVMAYPLLPLA